MQGKGEGLAPRLLLGATDSSKFSDMCKTQLEFQGVGPTFLLGYILHAVTRRRRALGGGAQVSDALVDKVHDCYHLPAVEGSDHVPLGIVLRD